MRIWITGFLTLALLTVAGIATNPAGHEFLHSAFAAETPIKVVEPQRDSDSLRVLGGIHIERKSSTLQVICDRKRNNTIYVIWSNDISTAPAITSIHYVGGMGATRACDD